MKTFEVSPGRVWLEESARDFISTCVDSLGLEARLLELKSFPGSSHWHLKKPKTSGTLEATWDPKTGQLWLQVHSLRNAGWMGALIEEILEIAKSL